MRPTGKYTSEERWSFIYFLKPHLSYLMTNIELQRFHRVEIFYVSLSKSPDPVHVAKRDNGEIEVTRKFYCPCFCINYLWLRYPLCCIARTRYDLGSAAYTVSRLQHDAIDFINTDTKPPHCVRCYGAILSLSFFRISHCAPFVPTLPSALTALLFN